MIKKVGYLLAGILSAAIIMKIIGVAGSSPEKVTDILSHWAIDWAKGGLVGALIVAAIFAINRHVENTRDMNTIGMILFTLITPILLTFLFGYNIWLIAVGGLVGLIIGYFTYIIDDHLLDAWQVRHIALPIFFGLGFGGSVVIATVTENWQDETIQVSDHATCTQVNVERYTFHYRSSKKGGSYHSWDVHDTHYFFNNGEIYPTPKPDVDFKLGTGADGEKDRVGSISHHKWVGGNKVSKAGEDMGFKWIYLDDKSVVFQIGKTYDIEENYFGHAMSGKKESFEHLKIEPLDITLPTKSDIPGVFGMFFKFFKIMFTESNFSLLRWIYALVYIPFLLLMIFVAEYRISFWIFLASSTVVILIIIAIILARSGKSIGDLGEKRFSGFGGGGFGGGGAGGRY